MNFHPYVTLQISSHQRFLQSLDSERQQITFQLRPHREPNGITIYSMSDLPDNTRLFRSYTSDLRDNTLFLRD